MRIPYCLVLGGFVIASVVACTYGGCQSASEAEAEARKPSPHVKPGEYRGPTIEAVAEAMGDDPATAVGD